MLNKARAVWIIAWAALLTLGLFIPIVVAALLGRRGNTAFRGTQAFAWVLLKVIGIKLVVHGWEHIQPGQRYVILSNHASYLDPPSLVLALGVQYRWVIKQELRKVPLFGLALETSRNLFIDRTRGHDAMAEIRRGVEQLPAGTSVLMFPEGTRSPDGRLLPFKRGGFVVARECGLPILPVTIRGSHERLPKGQAVFHSGVIEIFIHPPVMDPVTALEAQMADVRDTIASVLR